RVPPVARARHRRDDGIVRPPADALAGMAGEPGGERRARCGRVGGRRRVLLPSRVGSRTERADVAGRAIRRRRAVSTAGARAPATRAPRTPLAATEARASPA